MSPGKGGRNPLVVLFLTVFIDLVGFGMVIPLLAFYGRHFGASSLEVGLLGGVYSFMQFLMAPVWGSLSDRYGRRPILLSSLFGISCAYLLFSQAEQFPHPFAVLFGARALAGLFAANISTAVAYVADVTTPENRAKGMGMIGAAFGLGFVFGPALGGLPKDIMTPPLIAAGLSLLAFLMALVALPESHTDGKQRQLGLAPLLRAFTTPGLKDWINAYLFYMVAVAATEIAFPLFVSGAPFEYTTRQNGYLFTYLGLLVAGVQGGGIRKMVKRRGEGPVARQGAVFSVLGLLVLPFATTLPVLMVGLTLLAIGQGFTQPTLMALISRTASKDEQGSVMGVSQSLASFGRIVGPALAGWLYGVNIRMPFLTAAALIVLVIAFMALAGRTPPPPTSPSQPVPDEESPLVGAEEAIS